MFTRHTHILYIGDGYVEPSVVSLRGDRVVETLPEIPYMRGALAEAVRRAHAISGGQWRLVINERFAYVTAIEWPTEKPLSREAVREAAEAVIPEDLRATEWDFRSFQFVRTDRQIVSASLVQIAALERSFANELSKAVRETHLRTDSAMPESYALAALASFDEPELIVFGGRGSDVLLATEKGVVVATEVLEDKKISLTKAVEHFARFIETHKRFRPSTLVISGISAEQSTSLREWGAPMYQVREEAYHVALGAALRDEAGDDADTLRFPLQYERTASGSWRRWWRR